MTFQVTTRAWLCDLHCSVGLTDWDMDNELKLATTTDQCYHEDKLNDQYVAQKRSTSASRRKDEFIWYDKTSDTFVKPNPWLWVNPHIICSVEYEKPASLQTLGGPDQEDQTSGTLHTKHSPKAEFCNLTSHSRTLLPPDLPSTEFMVHNDTSSNACMMKNGGSRKPAKARCKRRTPMDNSALKPGCWPRPPVNYCILITLALKTSPSGSLKVQQIYNFIREHFPFFQTAPDGWKNTIRHNLCFNSSFRKTCNQLCRDGKRKSCFWHLTLEGQRRLKDDLSVLTGESLKQLERSMSHPDMIQSIPAM